MKLFVSKLRFSLFQGDKEKIAKLIEETLSSSSITRPTDSSIVLPQAAASLS